MKMKNLMVDIDAAIAEAMVAGANTEEDVLAHVLNIVPFCNTIKTDLIRSRIETFMGPLQESIPE